MELKSIIIGSVLVVLLIISALVSGLFSTITFSTPELVSKIPDPAPKNYFPDSGTLSYTIEGYSVIANFYSVPTNPRTGVSEWTGVILTGNDLCKKDDGATRYGLIGSGYADYCPYEWRRETDLCNRDDKGYFDGCYAKEKEGSNYARDMKCYQYYTCGSEQQKEYIFWDNGLCYWNVDIKKDGKTIYKYPIEGWTATTGVNASFINDEIEIDFNEMTSVIKKCYAIRYWIDDDTPQCNDWADVKSCNSFGHKIVFKPQEFVDITIMEPKTYDLFEDQTYNYIIAINNSYMPMKAKISTKYGMDIAFGLVSKTIDSIIDLKVGMNYIPINVPTKKVTDEIKLISHIELYIGSEQLSFNNIQIQQGKNFIDFKDYGELEIGEITSKEYIFRIHAKPLWTELTFLGDCQDGYILSYNNKYCIRSDIKDLTCMQMGCPILSGHEYTCTSAGICAEVIYVYKDCSTEGCPEIEGENISVECLSDGVCQYIQNNTIIKEKKLTCVDEPEWCGTGFTCDIQTQVCMEDKVYQEIGECRTNLDCYVPCKGMSIECKIPTFSSTGYCSYSGECESREIDCRDVGCAENAECVRAGLNYVCEKITIVQKTCGELGCPDGMICDMDTGSCIYTEYISRDCRTEGCDDGYSCNEKRGVCEKGAELNLGLIIGIIIGIFSIIGVGIFLLFKK